MAKKDLSKVTRQLSTPPVYAGGVPVPRLAPHVFHIEDYLPIIPTLPPVYSTGFLATLYYMVDALVAYLRYQSYDVDALVAMAEQAEFSVDSFLVKNNSSSFTADATTASMETDNFTVDALACPAPGVWIRTTGGTGQYYFFVPPGVTRLNVFCFGGGGEGGPFPGDSPFIGYGGGGGGYASLNNVVVTPSTNYFLTVGVPPLGGGPSSTQFTGDTQQITAYTGLSGENNGNNGMGGSYAGSGVSGFDGGSGGIGGTLYGGGGGGAAGPAGPGGNGQPSTSTEAGLGGLPSRGDLTWQGAGGEGTTLTIPAQNGGSNAGGGSGAAGGAGIFGGSGGEALIIITWQAAIFFVDALLGEQASVVTFTVDSQIASTNSKSFSVDSSLANLKSKTFTVDSQIAAGRTDTFTTDSCVGGLKNKSFTVDSCKATLKNKSFTVDSYIVGAPPTVTSVSPTSGSTGGGTSVTIAGTNFTGATNVKFGATAATSFVVHSSIQIVAVSPQESTGTVDITVITPSGTSATSSADHFTFNPIAVVQAGQGTVTSSTVTVTFGSTTAGNLLVIQLALSFNTSVTAPSGWTKINTYNNPNSSIATLYYPNNPGGITSVAISVSQSAAHYYMYLEASGIATTSPLDFSSSGAIDYPQGTNNSPIPATGTLSYPVELVMGMLENISFVSGGGGVPTPVSTGWNVLQTYASHGVMWVYLIVSTTASEQFFSQVSFPGVAGGLVASSTATFKG